MSTRTQSSSRICGAPSFCLPKDSLVLGIGLVRLSFEVPLTLENDALLVSLGDIDLNWVCSLNFTQYGWELTNLSTSIEKLFPAVPFSFHLKLELTLSSKCG